MGTLNRLAIRAIIGLLGTAAALAQPRVDARPLTLGSYWVDIYCDRPTSARLRWRKDSRDYCLDRNPLFDQRDVVSAEFDTESSQKSTIKLTLRETAARHLMEVTRPNVGNLIATVVNGELVSVATVQAPVDHIWISGLTEQEGKSLIDAIQRGAVSRTPALLPLGPERQPPDANGVYTMRPGISPPLLIHKEEPEYTESARAAGIRGSVSLEIVVKPDGTPDIIRVSRPLDPELDARAIECARKFRFRPATMDGKPVPVRATLEINFRP